MAVPVHFPEADFILGPPGGHDAAVPVPVRRRCGGRLITCWLPSIEEIEEIARTRRIWLELEMPAGRGLVAPSSFVTAFKDQVLGNAPR
jgi:hypothetical protein